MTTIMPPGFFPALQPDSKLRMLMQLADQAEIVIVISAADIEKNKVRGDLGITYDVDVLRLIRGIYTTRASMWAALSSPSTAARTAQIFSRHKLEHLGIRVYRHYMIEGYPSNIPLIVSDEGYGKNDYIETTRPLVVVTAPGPGSGKMATCLSQLYHENKRGVKAGYAKFETFPIWNIPLKHPVNLAYEAATADLNDVNMIDPFHLEAYGETTVNYNRDVEIFPVLNAIFEGIYGESPYKSPTDMGVNMAGNCICDDEVCREASRQEIIRRYYDTLRPLRIRRMLRGRSVQDRAAHEPGRHHRPRPTCSGCSPRAARKQTGAPAAALELPDGTIVTGKTSDLLGASAALLLNALKELAGIDHDLPRDLPGSHRADPEAEGELPGKPQSPPPHGRGADRPVCQRSYGQELAQLALEQLPKLNGCQLHTSVMLSYRRHQRSSKNCLYRQLLSQNMKKRLYFQEEKGI